MKGIGSIVSFIAIFLIISLEMMGGAEGKPQPQPEPQPGPIQETLPPCGDWCRTPKYNYNCQNKGMSVCEESSIY